MSEGGDWEPRYRAHRWAPERAAFARWRTGSGRVWSPLRRQRFRRWLIEHRAHEDALMYQQLADEQRERLAHRGPEVLVESRTTD